MEKVKISKVCKISNGFAFKSDKYMNTEGGRVIRITNVQKGKIIDNDPKLYPFSELKNLENYKIDEGDILMSLTGNVGRVGKFPKELLPAYINQRVCRIKSNSNNLIDDYLYHFLNSDKFENDAVRNSAGAAQLNLSTNWLADYEIPLPSIPTQQKIAIILDKADELRQYNKQLIAKYDALTQSLFLDMFGDPVRNEKDWEIKELKKGVDNLQSGLSLSGEERLLVNDEIAVLKISSVTSGFFKSNEHKVVNRSDIKKPIIFPRKGDLLFSRANTREKVGAVAIVDKDYTNLFLPDKLWRIDTNNFLNNIFLKFLLSHQGFRYNIEKVSTGTSGSMLNISMQKFYNIETPFPPIELQNQFSERVKLIEAQKQQAQEALVKSEALFQGLLQRAFKGELVY